MIWYGQYNAILLLSLIASVALGIMFGSWQLPVVVFVLVVIVRTCASFVNLIACAIFGFPLIYDTKFRMLEEREKRRRTHAGET